MDYFLNLLDDKKHSILFFVCILVVIAMIFQALSPVRLFIGSIVDLIYILVCVIAFWIWYRQILILPRNKTGRIGIVISLVSENSMQEKKLKRDFIKSLQDDVSKANKKDLPIDVLVLKKHQAEKLLKTKDTKKIQKTIKAHFYIVGEVIERKINGSDNYIIENGYILYGINATDKQKDRLEKIMRALCLNATIDKNNEYKGFEITSKLIAFNVKYIIGIAALIYGDVSFAYSIHSVIINSEYKKIRSHPNHDFILQELKKIIHEESEILCDLEFQKHNYEGGVLYINKIFELQISVYSGLLRRAIYEFKIGDISSSLKTINSAKKYSHLHNGEWRFSKAFLFLWLEEYPKFNIERKNIIKKCSLEKYHKSFFDDMILFSENQYLKNQEKHQLSFWIGYILYKFKRNGPQALKYFEKFILNSDDKHFLKNEAIQYNNEIIKLIGLDG